MNLSIRTKAIIALILTGILGGLSSFFMKVILKEFSSYQILFLRFGIASILVVPLILRQYKSITFEKIKYTIPSGLLFSGNVFFFIVGLQYTTSIVSQLFYLLAPVIVSLLTYLLFKEKTSMRRIVSMFICFGGSSLLVLRSVQSGKLINSIGTFQGNILILCAVTSWAVYAVYTKQISKKIEPSFFLITNFITAFLASIVGLLITKTPFISTVLQFTHSSTLVLLSLLFLASVNSFLFFFLYQWSMKHVSAFVASSTAYLSPLATALFAIPFLGEELSVVLVISAVSIFIGSYFILSEKK